MMKIFTSLMLSAKNACLFAVVADLAGKKVCKLCSTVIFVLFITQVDLSCVHIKNHK